MLDAAKNVPARDVLVSNKSPDLKNSRSETEDQFNSKSQLEGHDNVVLENETPTIDAGTDDMVSGYLNLTDDEAQNINKGEVNEVQLSEKMIYEVNQNGNDLTVARQEDIQMKENPTTVTTDGDARSYEFPKVKLKVTDSSIEKMPEPASPMFLINPSTTSTGEHSGEAS
ncbi:hypothetical protein H5410_061682 [Solanum commersonii]|uniref:Uncharacterized protein n=1 Tax=Solanum commersonii TaxID=4109 RepID=A0A9J5W9J3_SOLCO|nr:hypothetical protein H5410_061682 [Solanum commersonii]